MLLSTRYALQSLGQKVLPLFSSVIEFVGKILFCLLYTSVGDVVKKEDIHAKFEDGVLHIELPAPQQTKALPENPNLIAIE